MFIDWIKSGLQKPGKTQTALAHALGVTHSQVSRLLSGQRQVKAHELAIIAAYLEEPVPAIDERPMRERRPIPLLAWVSAGKMMLSDATDEAIGQVYEGGLDLDGDWIALKVMGDSMDRISPPESIIFIDRRDKELVPNACYVIENGHGEATYKRFRPNPMRFEPVSTNSSHETIFVDQEPKVVGRVKKTTLGL